MNVENIHQPPENEAAWKLAHINDSNLPLVQEHSWREDTDTHLLEPVRSAEGTILLHRLIDIVADIINSK